MRNRFINILKDIKRNWKKMTGFMRIKLVSGTYFLSVAGFLEPHTLYAENTIYLYHKINCYLFLIWPIVFTILIKTILINNVYLTRLFSIFITNYLPEVLVKSIGLNNYLSLYKEEYNYNKDLTTEELLEKVDGIENSEFGAYEITLTVTPVFILILIFIESGLAVYAADAESQISSFVNVKVVGGQWYWVYDIAFDVVGYKELETANDIYIRELQHINYNYVSNMITEDDLEFGNLRMLQVDNILYLPVNTPVKANITSRDVLHSFALPTAGWKMDAVPGRLNEMLFILKQPGIYVGMCSELCGVGHSAMPIMVHVIPLEEFFKVYGVSLKVEGDYIFN